MQTPVHKLEHTDRENRDLSLKYLPNPILNKAHCGKTEVKLCFLGAVTFNLQVTASMLVAVFSNFTLFLLCSILANSHLI